MNRLVSTFAFASSFVPFAALAGSSWDEGISGGLASSLAAGQVGFAVGAAFVGGFLTALTPCVYPLIPITIRYFGAMGSDVPRGRVMRLALTYIGGMALLYTGLATVFASLDVVFGSFLANSWVLLGIAFFCAAMGISMLGAFTVQLPPSLSARLSQVGGQTYPGAFGMGLVSGLVAAPCTGPVLAVILTVIAASGELGLGIMLMLSFSLGLGVPFLGIAAASGQLQRVPRSGPWMDLVKGVLATAMFVVALYFADIAIPAVGDLLAFSYVIASVLIVVGVFAGILALRLDGTFGKVAMLAATVALTCGISGVIFGDSETPSKGPGIPWVRVHDTGLSLARANEKPIMIDFTADWCVACKELDAKTFSDPGVQRDVSRFVAMKLDATDPDDAMDALLERYGVMGLPSVIFLNSKGELLEDPRVTGFVPPKRFREILARVD